MFIDARTLRSEASIEADLCIIGAGAAGITIAREFIGTKTKVALIESGELSYSSSTQALARGTNVGIPYFDLEGERARLFGGCTSHWGGDCRPLDPADLMEREWVPYSGWPFDYEALVPFYRRATSIVQIDDYDAFTRQDWAALVAERPQLAPVRFPDDSMRPRIWQKSPPTRFGEVYRAELERAENIATYMNANLVGFGTSEDGRRVERLQLACLNGTRFTASAPIFVLATGAIENARLLLAATDGKGRTLGNAHDLVGRFFQEHLSYAYVAMFLPATTRPMREFSTRGIGYLSISMPDETLLREPLANFSLFLEPRLPGADPPGVESLRNMSGAVRAGTLPDGLFTHLERILSDLPAVAEYSWRRLFKSDQMVGYFDIEMVLEQMPNPDSRVRLGRGRDPLGLPLAELDWRLTDADREAMMRATRRVAREVGRAELGRVKIRLAEDGSDWMTYLSGAHHPMGTTRMHRDPRRGVVDENGRLHDVANLYVAGTSVYPTGGASSPTFTLVALSLRLADHLKQRLV